MFASGERDSNWSTRTVPVVSTMNTSSSETNSAYWPRFLTMSSISSRLCCPLSSRMIRASRDSRARRNRAVNRKTPRVGIEPSRSSQPRRRMKYSLRGPRTRDVVQEVRQEHDADRVVEPQQRLVRRRAERQDHQRHHDQRHHRQDEDEDLVGVAVASGRSARRRGGHRGSCAGSDRRSGGRAARTTASAQGLEARVRLEQAQLHGPLDRLAAGRGPELPVDRHRVRLHGVARDAQPVRDLGEREVRRQERAGSAAPRR